MNVTDPIADMLTRIRNALTAKHDSVEIPASKMKIAIADILVDEGFVKSSTVVEKDGRKNIVIDLKYGPRNEKVLTGLKRISKPGLRVYSSAAEMPKVLGGMGIAIVSTSQGVITDKIARKNNIGGEVLAYVW